MLLYSFLCKFIDMDVISNQQDPHLKSDTNGWRSWMKGMITPMTKQLQNHYWLIWGIVAHQAYGKVHCLYQLLLQLPPSLREHSDNILKLVMKLWPRAHIAASVLDFYLGRLWTPQKGLAGLYLTGREVKHTGETEPHDLTLICWWC